MSKNPHVPNSMGPILVWCSYWMRRLPTFTFPFAARSVSTCSFSIQTIFRIRKTVACFSCCWIRIRKLSSNWMRQQLNRIRPWNNIRQSSGAASSCTSCRNNMPAITVTSIACSNANCERLWICAVVRHSFCPTIFPTEPRPTWNARSSTTNAWSGIPVSRICAQNKRVRN